LPTPVVGDLHTLFTHLLKLSEKGMSGSDSLL
jgi:hypothetical protein